LAQEPVKRVMEAG